MRQVALWSMLGVALLGSGCVEDQPSPTARAQYAKPANPVMNWEGRRSQDAGQIGDHYQTEGPKFWVRPGFRVTQVSSELGRARFLEVGAGDDVYLSRPGNGDILTMRLKAGKLETVATFAKGYPGVHGLCFTDGWLWFTQSGSIHKGRDANWDGVAEEVVTVFAEGSLPSGQGHSLRAILVTDRFVYTSIGDPGNITTDQETERKKIWRYNLQGGDKTLFASGIRNTEKLRLRQGTEEVWGADHGSDRYAEPLGESQGNQPMTDLNPPEEFNHYVEGGFYGHPFLMGHRVPRIEFQGRKDIVALAAKTIPPAWALGAHWAANGFTFYSGGTLDGDAFVALHGSWNRTVRSGYRIERILFDNVTGMPYGSQMIVGCLGEQGSVLARPVDVVQARDGSLLFSSDSNGAIYRIEQVPTLTSHVSETENVSSRVVLGPLAYFEAKCASCHGSEGSAYGPTFGQGLSEVKLRKVVVDMAAGPGGSPLAGQALEAQVAFHRALMAKEPFIAVRFRSGGRASGEKSMGATLSASARGKSLPVDESSGNWTVSFPASLRASEVVLRAVRAGKTTALSLDQPFSHAAPLAK